MDVVKAGVGVGVGVGVRVGVTVGIGAYCMANLGPGRESSSDAQNER